MAVLPLCTFGSVPIFAWGRLYPAVLCRRHLITSSGFATPASLCLTNKASPVLTWTRNRHLATQQQRHLFRLRRSSLSTLPSSWSCYGNSYPIPRNVPRLLQRVAAKHDDHDDLTSAYAPLFRTCVSRRRVGTVIWRHVLRAF